MSEEAAQAEDGQESSMEDILASIRRILSEEEAEAAVAAPEPEPEPEATPAPVIEPEPIPEHIAAPVPMPGAPGATDAVLELTPDMVATEIISEPTARASTDVLSQLAAAILDRRDLGTNASRTDITLEGSVREMLKPILREWLDRNLPYLIERLVKREIGLMVNRAEKLED